MDSAYSNAAEGMINGDKSLEMAKAAADNAQYAEAQKYASEALQAYLDVGDQSGSSNAYSWLGSITQQAGKYDESLSNFNQAIQTSPGNADLYRARGNLYVAMNQYDPAIIDFQKAIDLAPQDAAAYISLGQLYQMQNRTNEAIALFERAARLNPKSGTAYRYLGDSYANLDQTRKAIEFYEQALSIARETGDRREEANTLGNLGIANADLGETRKAVEFYEQALNIDREIGDRRGEAVALINLGVVNAGLGEARKAIEFYEQALNIGREIGDRGEEAVALSNLGNANGSLGETRKAIEFYEQALVIDREIGDRRGEASILWNLALASEASGKQADSISLAEAALKIYEQVGDSRAEEVRAKLASLQQDQTQAATTPERDSNVSSKHGTPVKAESAADAGRANDAAEDRFEYDVYISYSRKDRQWVQEELLQRLEERGLRVFIDFRDFQAGMPVVNEIKRAIYSSRTTLLVLTPDYLASEWATNESELAQSLLQSNQTQRLIPLLKEKCNPPPRLQMLAHVDFTNPANWGTAWQQLFNALGVAPVEGKPLRPEVPPSAVHEQVPTTPQSPAAGEPVFSDAAGRMLGLTEQIRARDRQPEILSTHLLLAMYITAPDASTQCCLAAFGIDYREVLQTLANSREVEELLTSKFEPEPVRDAAQLRLSEAVDDILKAAKQLAQTQSGTEIQPRHVFAALLGKPEASATRWLSDVLSPEVTQWIAHTVPELDDAQALTVEAVQQRAVKAGLYIAPTGVRDNAADTDLLGFATHADALASIILRDETKPPLVVGVYGPWGSGKSTFMQLVKQSLTKRATLVGTADRLTRRQHIAQFFRDIPGRFKKRLPVTPRPELIILEYDAWAYADAPKLWAGLVAQIAKELDAQLGFRGRLTYIINFRMKQLRNALLWGLVPVAVYIGGQLWNEFARTVLQSTFIADGLTLISTAFWGIKLFQAQKQPVSASIETLTAKFDTEPMSGVVHSIQDEVKNALNTKFPQPKPEDSARRDTTQGDIAQRVRENKLKIVVLIDELDRCPLERVVDILEAIKLFLSEEIFIVLMAIDTRVAAEAIRLHYKDVKNPDLPHEYLEKIVQLPLQVPRAGDKALKVYLESHMPTAAAALKQAADEEKKRADGSSGPTLNITPPAISANVPTALPRREPHVPRRANSISSRPKFSETPIEFNQVAILAEKFLESNPRRIKRLLNTYRYVKMLANAQKEPVDTNEWQKSTLAWLAFTMRWPAFMEAACTAREALEQKYPDSASILKTALIDEAGEYEKPGEPDIDAYLSIDAKRLKVLCETAGNFLIEIPMGVMENHNQEKSNGEKLYSGQERKVDSLSITGDEAQVAIA